MLRINKINQELEVLQEHLHDAVASGGKDVLKHAKVLEKELAGIVERAERYTEQLELLMEFSSILNSTLETARRSAGSLTSRAA